MYVLRDITYRYEDLKAQIDYIIITPVYIYYVECKNLVGDIIINKKGEFIREYSFYGRKVRKGMYSPIRQVEAQREVMRKIWEKHTSKLIKLLASKKFEYYRRVLVVTANESTIINTNRAPKDLKYKIIRADSLIRKIKYDLAHRERYEPISSKKEMEEQAKYYLKISVNENIDFYEYYKNKYCASCHDENLRKKLMEFRKERAKKLKMPAYYIFSNEEMEILIKTKPKTLDELKSLRVIPSIKIKIHGKEIINVINSF